MVRQAPAPGIVAFSKSWQKSLHQLVQSLPRAQPLVATSLLGTRHIGLRISQQIFELLGKKVFPSDLEANLIQLRQLFVDFDGMTSEDEQQVRLREAQKILNALVIGDGNVHDSNSDQRTLMVKTDKASNLTGAADLWTMPIRFAKGVGPSRARLLEKLGVTTIEEALWFLPWRYEDWTPIVPIAQLQLAMKATVLGRVTSCQSRRTSRKGLVIITISLEDETGALEAVFFNQPFLEQIFVPGTSLLLHGDVLSSGARGMGAFQMRAPQHELIHRNVNSGDRRGRVLPIYHETKGMTTRQFRRVLKGLYERFHGALAEVLSPDLLQQLQLPSLQTAVRRLHFPDNSEDVEALNHGTSSAHQRLAFEELLLLQLALAVRRRMVKAESASIACSLNVHLIEKLRGLLPFTLTGGQERVIREIEMDMAQATPMNRLLQGDVGSGKTMVALHAMVLACGSGYQAVLMAPTEILSEQHFFTVEPYLRQLELTAVFIKGGQSSQERAKSLEQLASGQAHVAVGTHALLQPEVVFSNLGLVVVDEQHKFGVVQRAQLRKKCAHSPDVLVMTATPIPRTLAMTVYGDLDVSVINGIPPGRKTVQTMLFRGEERKRVYAFLRKEVALGRQAYIVYPLIERSEKVDLQAATEAAEGLQREEFPELTVGVLHGRMKSKEKQAVMTAFKRGTVHILVATTVIEVGVDVSNATVMVIEHAERFGLAQLHQLRGRVGRGAQQAYCILVQSEVKPTVGERLSSANMKLPLFHGSPRSGGRVDDPEKLEFQRAGHRLEVFTRCADGFALAEEDLHARGPGNLLGVQQWGTVEFLVAELVRDRALLIKARRFATQLLAQDPQLSSSKFQGLRAAMLRKWGKTFDLGSIG